MAVVVSGPLVRVDDLLVNVLTMFHQYRLRLMMPYMQYLAGVLAVLGNGECEKGIIEGGWRYDWHQIIKGSGVI